MSWVWTVTIVIVATATLSVLWWKAMRAARRDPNDQNEFTTTYEDFVNRL